MTQAIDDVLAERQRQQDAEGWTPEHDDAAHRSDELLKAAVCYAWPQWPFFSNDEQDVHSAGHWHPSLWPWAPKWWKPRGKRRNLVRAAALLIAEIERLDRRAPEETISIGQMFAEVMKTEAAQERFFPFEFEVWQGDNMVASASGPRDDALREAMNYAAQYEQDGPARVFEVTRTLATPNADVTGLAPAQEVEK